MILAGGQSRRMGGSEKSLLEIDGAPLISHVRTRLAPQVGSLGVNANGDASRFGFLHVPVFADRIGGFAGPLAGLHAGMEWLAENGPDHTHLVTVAADTLFFPLDLASALTGAAHDQTTIVLAASAGHRHPVFGLWPVALAADLALFLSSQESRKVIHFVERHKNAVAEFPMKEVADIELDPFFNINTPAEYDWACTVWNQVHDSART